MTFKQMCRTFLGIDAEIKRASDDAYLAGFMAGLKTHAASVRGSSYMAGFMEGRASVKSVPLDDEEAACRLH